MSFFDAIPGIGKYVSIFESIASALKRISEDAGIKEKYLKTGIVAGHLTLYENYELDFRFRNTDIINGKAQTAEIVEHCEEETNGD